MASGRPVIAYAYGGALDTVLEGTSGTLFAEQTVASLCEALQRFDPEVYDPQAIRDHAAQFDASVFRLKIASYVEQAWEEHRRWS
jgi:glycosyltransferase involved in cell wall biosynthesis